VAGHKGEELEMGIGELKKIEDLRAENERLKQEINGKGGYKELVQGLNVKAGNLEQEVKRLKAELKPLVEERITVEKMDTSIKETIESLEAQVKTLSEERDRYKESSIVLGRQVSEDGKRIAALEQGIQKIKVWIESKASTVSGAHWELTDIDALLSPAPVREAPAKTGDCSCITDELCDCVNEEPAAPLPAQAEKCEHDMGSYWYAENEPRCLTESLNKTEIKTCPFCPKVKP